MFYSGFKTFLIFFVTIYLIVKLFYNLVLYKIFTQFSNISFNDSIEVLCLISSPIYTLLFLTITTVVVYINFIRQLPNKFFFMWFLYNYFLNFNCFSNVLQHIFKTSMLNLNLQNGLLNVHPYIIYILYSWIIVYMCSKTFKHKCFLPIFSNSTNLTAVSYLLFFGILLGAWWASQELNWGGFWSWDPVELISLLIFMYVVSVLHKPNCIYKLTPVFTYLLVSITIYFIMRLGVVSTVHSFIKNLNMPFYIYTLYTIIILFGCKKYFKYMYKYWLNTHVLKLDFYNYNKNMTVFFIKILLGLIVITLVLLVCINLNLIPNEFIPSLNLIFIINLYVFLILYLTKNKKFFYKLIFFLFFLFLSVLNSSYIIILCYFYLIFGMHKHNTKLLHFLFLWAYTLYIYFFITVLQYTHNITSNFNQTVVTDYYTNSALLNYYENTQFFKKKYYLTVYKTQLCHILSFKTISNNTLTYFITLKNSDASIIYNEEFIFMIVYTLLIFIFYWFKKFYLNLIKFY